MPKLRCNISSLDGSGCHDMQATTQLHEGVCHDMKGVQHDMRESVIT